jgi:imidazolonepropionase-like amidohydrolase
MAAVGLLLAPAPWALAQAPIAIQRVRVIDGNGGAPLESGTVVIRDGRIVAVGAASAVAIPSGARTIDGRGHSLIPGLADLHTHLTGGWDGVSVDFLGFRRVTAALLYAGVTTVLDPGNVTSFVKQLRDEVEAGRVAGPRIHYAGAIFDGPQPAWPDISLAVSSADQLPSFVKQLRQAGVSFVKAYGGLSTETVQALVDAAARDSLRVVADVGGRNGSLEVARTGIAAFAHAGRRPMTDEAIRYLADHGIATITTLAVMEVRTRRRFADLRFLDHPLLADVLPPSYQAGLRAHGARPADTAAARGAATALSDAMANVKRMHDAGVLLAAGTDAPYPGDFYGEGLHRELELLVEAGLTPLQAITIATRNAARLLGAVARWGTIEPDKQADVVLVRGDPSRAISDTRNVVTVIQGGRVVDRAALRYDPRREPDHHPAVLRQP